MEAAIIIAIVTGIPGLIAAILVFRQSGRANNTQDKQGELAWVKELRADAIDTRKEMEAAQEQVRTLRRQLDVVTREADHWIHEYQFFHRTVWRDGISVERLRELLGPPPPEPPAPTPGANGSRLIR